MSCRCGPAVRMAHLVADITGTRVDRIWVKKIGQDRFNDMMGPKDGSCSANSRGASPSMIASCILASIVTSAFIEGGEFDRPETHVLGPISGSRSNSRSVMNTDRPQRRRGCPSTAWPYSVLANIRASSVRRAFPAPPPLSRRWPARRRASSQIGLKTSGSRPSPGRSAAAGPRPLRSSPPYSGE